MSIRTWFNRKTGVLTNRMTIRVSHDLSLSELIDGLASSYARSGEPLPTGLSASKIRDEVRDEYAYYGTNAVWTWADGESERHVEEVRAWAEAEIIRAFPELGENRG